MAKKTPIDKPSGDNSHEDNVKVALESVLGGKTRTRKVKKSPEDKQRDAFYSVITALELVENREFLLKEEFTLDLMTYNDSYHDAIDGLFKVAFSESQISIIYFYLYSRIDVEGSVMPLELQDGQLIYLNTAVDLFEYIKTLK